MTLPEPESRPVILCFAGDRWDGNPHSRHHLMRRFARRFEVLFIESVPMRSVAVGERGELRRVAGKLRGGTRLRTAEPSLHVLRPLPVPPTGPVGRRAQIELLHLQVQRARRRLRLEGPAVTWFSVPVAAPLRGRFGERGSLFYYQDRYDSFSHVDAARLRAQVADLAAGCDVSIATSEALREDLVELNARPTVVPHGVDLERFAGPAPVPSDLDDLERPLIGYAGMLDDYLDFDCLLAVAERLERGTLVLVGPSNVDLSALKHPRIAILGPRPYESMPGYLEAFSCCLVPFRINELTEGVNPIKLREYLAAGRPVTSTPMREVKPYGDVVSIAATPAEFGDAALREALPENDDAVARERRRARVADESWDAAAAAIEVELDAIIGR